MECVPGEVVADLAQSKAPRAKTNLEQLEHPSWNGSGSSAPGMTPALQALQLRPTQSRAVELVSFHRLLVLDLAMRFQLN